MLKSFSGAMCPFHGRGCKWCITVHHLYFLRAVGKLTRLAFRQYKMYVYFTQIRHCLCCLEVGPLFSAIMGEDVIIPVRPTYVSFPKRTGGAPCGTTFIFRVTCCSPVAAYEVDSYSAECMRKREKRALLCF